MQAEIQMALVRSFEKLIDEVAGMRYELQELNARLDKQSINIKSERFGEMNETLNNIAISCESIAENVSGKVR